ncbi:hypothetical protein D9M71_711020 [compost metagenome]
MLDTAHEQGATGLFAAEQLLQARGVVDQLEKVVGQRGNAACFAAVKLQEAQVGGGATQQFVLGVGQLGAGRMGFTELADQGGIGFVEGHHGLSVPIRLSCTHCE